MRANYDRMRRLRAIWCYLESWPRATIYQIGADFDIAPTTALRDLRTLSDQRIISAVCGAKRVLLRRYSAEWLENV